MQGEKLTLMFERLPLPKFEEHNDVHDDDEKHRECKGGDEEADMKGFEAVVLLVITTVGI